MIYQPQIVNSVLMNVSKEPKFFKTIFCVYCALLIWIITGSTSWQDLFDDIKSIYEALLAGKKKE